MLNDTTNLPSLNESMTTTYCKQGVQGPYFILVAYVCSGLVLFGLPANILTICVLKADTKRNTARYLMLVLATQDLILLIVYSTYYIVPLLYARHRWFSFCIQIIWKADSPILFLLGWFKFSEAYTIVLISIDRFLALRYPFKSVRICTVSNAKRIQIVIALVGFFIKLPILVLDFCFYDGLSQCDSCEPIFQDQPWHKMFWLVYGQLFDQIVTYLVPLLCLLFINIYLIWKLQSVATLKEFENNSPRIQRASSEVSSEVKKKYSPTKITRHLRRPTPRLGRMDHHQQQSGFSRNESQDVILKQRWRTHQARNISAMLICVITVFIACETPTALYFFYDLHAMIWIKEEERVPVASLYAIALFTANLNFASNFLIYGLVGRRFRWMLRQTISRWKYMCLHCKRRRLERREVQKRMLHSMRILHIDDDDIYNNPLSLNAAMTSNKDSV